MNIAIDASNIRSGGGLTHLYYFLSNIDPKRDSFKKIYVWACQETLNFLPDKNWLIKINLPILERNFIARGFWQLNFGKLASNKNCDVIFSPGGTSLVFFKPTVLMSQNLLPFETQEISKYGFSIFFLKFLLLRFIQILSFKKSAGIIFLTNYSMHRVLKFSGSFCAKTQVVHHGIEKTFFSLPRAQFEINQYSIKNPFKILYVSSLEPYKHQYEVIMAVHKLRMMGMPVSLDIVGPFSNPAYSNKVKLAANSLDPYFKYIRIRGPVPHETLPAIYLNSNLFVFASSCEAFGQILLEAMASGLPIACSDSLSISELIGDAAVFFRCNNVENIADILRNFILHPKVRKKKALDAYNKAKNFSWRSSAIRTINFINSCASKEG